MLTAGSRFVPGFALFRSIRQAAHHMLAVSTWLHTYGSALGGTPLITLAQSSTCIYKVLSALRQASVLFQHRCIHHTDAMHACSRSSLTTQVHTSGCKVHLMLKIGTQCSVFLSALR